MDYFAGTHVCILHVCLLDPWNVGVGWLAVNQHVDDRNQTQVGPVQEQRVFLTTEQCLQP